MNDDKMTGLDRLEEEINEQILAASDEEIMGDAEEAGDDPADFAARMRVWLKEAEIEAGQRRRLDARAELEKDHRNNSPTVVALRKSKGNLRPDSFMPDTMAARHDSGGMSEGDKKALDEDLDELFDDDAWEPNTDDADE